MMTDLQILTEKYKKTVTQLEGQIAEIRRKMDIVAEASRLLEEEGLVSDVAGAQDYATCCNLSGMEEPFLQDRG
jgi:hypothetical protein